MRRLIGGLASTLLLLTASLTPANQAEASDAPAHDIVDLHLVGGDGWSPENRFDLRWDYRLPPEKDDPSLGSVRYRVLDGAEELLSGERPGRPQSLTLELPSLAGGLPLLPDEYTAEIWTLDRYGNQAQRRTATLRFDDGRPGPAAPRFSSAWFRGDVEPVLSIVHPPGPQPVSGIRGYAVSVRRGSPAPPCAGPSRCATEEIDLGAGVGDDRLGLGLLPEGLHAVSVVAVSNSGMRSQIAATTELRIDATRPDLSLDGAGGAWTSHPVRVLARASDPLSGMSPSGPTGPRTTIAVDGGTPTVAQGGEVAAIVSGDGVHSVAASARDAAGNARGEDSSSPPLTGVVRIDEGPPAVSFAGSGDPADPEAIEATVADPLSGPAPAGSIGVRPVGSAQAFEPLPTAAAGGRLSARWDSDSYPRGAYEFKATGYDAAGNRASSSSREAGAPMVLVNPVKAPTAIRFGFGGRRLVWHRCVREDDGRRCRREVIESFARRPATRVVPYGQGLQVGGQALSASGAPLAGVPVEVVENFEAGAGAAGRATVLQTAADGTFLTRLAPGPSRRIEARFAGSRVLTRAASRELRLGVQTAVRLRASTAHATIGGRPVVFSGRVGHFDATIPPYGRPVQFQFRLAGEPWTEFRTVQTDALGRFRYPYAFSDDDSRGVRFLFRAYVPPQPGWPYEPAASRPVAVTGY